MHNTNHKINNINKVNQSGVTLVIGLVLLLVMTLIGITAMKTTALEEKMAGGLRNKVLAEGGVESALREAESYLWNYFAESNGVALVSDDSATFGVYTWEADDAVEFRQSIEWETTGQEYNRKSETLKDLTDKGNASLKENPRYIIEEIVNGTGYAGLAEFGDDGYGASAGILRTYRITARSYSGDGNIIEMAESVFSTRTK